VVLLGTPYSPWDFPVNQKINITVSKLQCRPRIQDSKLQCRTWQPLINNNKSEENWYPNN
jgi:hypothetical protein